VLGIFVSLLYINDSATDAAGKSGRIKPDAGEFGSVYGGAGAARD
jgi:hypothetical protein